MRPDERPLQLRAHRLGMCRVASAPKPVEIPYAGVGAAASTSTAARAADRARASAVELDPGAVTRHRHDVVERDRPDPEVPIVRCCSVRGGEWHDAIPLRDAGCAARADPPQSI